MKELTLTAEGAIQKGSKTFSFASRFFGAEKARDAALLYHWCRACDDAIDEGRGSPEELREQLLEAKGPAAALDYLARKYGIPRHYPLELLEGMSSDANFQAPANLRELELYCYRVAGVVGLMMAHIMGVSSEGALRSASDLGMAMQLTNIARDVRADFEMGRCYLPADLLGKHGLNQTNYFQMENRAALASAVTELLDLADVYYRSGEAGTVYLSARSSLVILIARHAYARIGEKVRAAGTRAWDRRQITSTFEKMKSFLRAANQWLGQLRRRPAWSPIPISTVWRFS